MWLQAFLPTKQESTCLIRSSQVCLQVGRNEHLQPHRPFLDKTEDPRFKPNKIYEDVNVDFIKIKSCTKCTTSQIKRRVQKRVCRRKRKTGGVTDRSVSSYRHWFCSLCLVVLKWNIAVDVAVGCLHSLHHTHTYSYTKVT